MKRLRSFAFWSSCAALLAACGGGDLYVPGSGSPSGAPTTKGSFTSIVSFGDSLSDVGTYTPATSLAGDGTPPYFGGKFTTNETSNGQPDAKPLGKIWLENIVDAGVHEDQVARLERAEAPAGVSPRAYPFARHRSVSLELLHVA